MPPKKHVHKYEFANIGKIDKPRMVYRCVLPDCTHFQPHTGLMSGKKSICWGCGKEFIIGSNIIAKEVRRPRCVDCKANDYRNKRGSGPPGVVKALEKKKRIKETDAEIDKATEDLLAKMKGLLG